MPRLRVASVIRVALLLTFAPVAWLAFVFVPANFPFAEIWDYAYDVGAYYLVDLPYHAHVPRPHLRFYFVCYLYAGLAVLTFVLEQIATWAYPTTPAAAASGTPTTASGIVSVSDKSDESFEFYVRTDIYSSRQDALAQCNSLSSSIASLPADDGYHNPTTSAQFNFFRSVDTLPYVTSALPGTGGVLKQTPAHFRVIEIDDMQHHAPDGLVDDHGACHIYVTLTREGLNTADVQRMLADAIGVETRDIGMCGLKDKWARCTQTFSVPSYSQLQKRHLSPAELKAVISKRYGATLEIERTAVSSTKLRRNMHSGNQFEIVVSDINLDSAEALKRAEAILDRLSSLGGIPNYYGAQRFSVGSQCALRGGRLLLQVQSCRSGSKKKRLRNSVVRSPVQKFFLSAFSSMLFNVWLGRRIEAGNFKRLLDGDLLVGDEIIDTKGAKKRAQASHESTTEKTKKKTKKRDERHRFSFARYVRDENNGVSSSVPKYEDMFELGTCSYTGPMFGSRCPMPRAGSEAHIRESEVEDLGGVLHTTYRTLDVYGTRRLGRLVVEDLEMSICQWHSNGKDPEGSSSSSSSSAAAANPSTKRSALLFSFKLPRGSYATAVLREFCKVPLQMEKSDKIIREDDHRAKKRLKAKVSSPVSTAQTPPPAPMSVDELVSCCKKHGIPFQGPQVTFNTDGYRVLYLRGKRKPRRHSLVVYQPNSKATTSRPTRNISEWSRLLKYKHTARLSDEKCMMASLGCKKTELSPLSVCNRNRTSDTSLHLQPITVGIDQALLDEEETNICWMKVDHNSDDSQNPCRRLGLRISAYIQLLRACGVEPVVV
eukprot:g2608.t1